MDKLWAGRFVLHAEFLITFLRFILDQFEKVNILRYFEIPFWENCIFIIFTSHWLIVVISGCFLFYVGKISIYWGIPRSC